MGSACTWNSKIKITVINIKCSSVVLMFVTQSPLSHNPVFILIGGALWVEGQVKAWISGLSCMGRVVQVTLRDLDLCTPSDLVARLAGATRAKIHEVRSSLPGRPIVLVGFSSAASIACSVRLVTVVKFKIYICVLSCANVLYGGFGVLHRWLALKT